MAVRRITKTVFLVLNILALLIFGLVCLAPYLDPKKWWAISLMGLGFVFIVVILIFFIFFWLVFKPKYALLSIAALLLGWKSLSVFMGFHFGSTFDHAKAKGTLRVAHWNVARFVEWKRNNNKGSQIRQKMMDLIREQEADVICIQEFFTSTNPALYNNTAYIMKELGYPYAAFSGYDDGWKDWSGGAIFSRLPIVDSSAIYFPPSGKYESLLSADVVSGSDTIRFYTTHLQSVRFKEQDYRNIERIKDNDTGILKSSRSIFSKLKQGVLYRSVQADKLRSIISASPYPYILTGDFNDIPNSYTYYTIRDGDLQDAFLQTSLGIGRTFNAISPTLRIDYILATKNFKIHQFNRIVKRLSDHYMLVADVELKK